MKTELTQTLEEQRAKRFAVSPEPAVEKRTHIIQPTPAWSFINLRELWEYRDLLFLLTWRDLTARYRQSALGPLWILLQPLMNMVLYTLLFGIIAQMPSQGKPYAVFSYVALLPWTFFATAFTNGVSGLGSAVSLSAKVYFPRIMVPLAKTISALVDLGMSFVILLGMLFFYNIQPNWGIAFLPLFLLLAAVTGLGVGLWFSGVVVKYRDIGQLTGFLARIWMYATPVVYSIEIVPEKWLNLYRLNPMTGVVEGFRWALLNTGEAPSWLLMLISGVVSVFILVIGLYIFNRAERNIVDLA